MSQLESHQFEIKQFGGWPIRIRRRGFFRRITLSIKVSGEIIVTCSKTLPIWRLQRFLDSHRDWLLKTQAKMAALRSKNPEFRLEDGYKVFFAGQPLTIKLKPGIGTLSYCARYADELWIKGSQSRALEALKRFYELEGRAALTDAVRRRSLGMGLFPRELKFRNQRSRWGSCTSQGNISLNWRLMAFRPSAMDYVVVHELAHLMHTNHSKAFWNLVATHCPNFEDEEKYLREMQYAADFLCVKSELHP